MVQFGMAGSEKKNGHLGGVHKMDGQGGRLNGMVLVEMVGREREEDGGGQVNGMLGCGGRTSRWRA